MRELLFGGRRGPKQSVFAFIRPVPPSSAFKLIVASDRSTGAWCPAA